MTTSQHLEDLGIHKVGHQEIMLDAINLLCNLHYRQSFEDLQSVTLNLNTRTNCLTKFLQSRSRNGSYHTGRNGTNVPQSIPASVLVLIAEIITAAKTVISWLDRPPFVTGDHFFKMFREDILKSALDLTQVGQQTGSLQQIEERLLEISKELGDFSDNLVKKASDPLIIQTATIDFVSIKKKRSDEELGLEIRTSAIDGTHLITLVKPNSASGSTDRVHIGDEILQVNYQTVVGWHHSKVIEALKCNVGDITFTLKKRPRHLSQPGQIQRPKQNPFLHPSNLGISSLPYRRPSAGRKRVVVKDDMYLPHREAEKRQQGEEEEEEEERFGITITVPKRKQSLKQFRPPDTPSGILDSPLDSPLADTSFLPPRGFPLGRRPTMVPGMAHARRKNKVRQDRPRSLPSDLEELRKELNKSSLGKTDETTEKIKPLPADFRIPTTKINGRFSDTEPMPETKSLFPQSDKEDDQQQQASAAGAASEATDAPQLIRKTTAKGVSVKFKDDVVSPTKVSDDHQSDEVDGVTGQDGGVKGQGSNDSASVVNTNNNEDTEIPSELKDLIEVVDDMTVSDEFVVVEMPSPDQTDGPGRLLKQTKRSESTSTVDSTDSVRLRKHKTKGRFKRGVSCADLGPGECEGQLWIKRQDRIGQKWHSMWFVLKEFVLYYYKDQKSDKAKGVICLPGFQVILSPDSRRSYAFKLKHPGNIKDILLAANDQKCLKNWMEKLQLATIMLQDETKVRQSTIITETILKRLDLGGYHSSESTDEESRKGSYDLAQESGDSSDATSVGTNSQPGSINSMSPGAAEAIESLKGEPSPISIIKYDQTTYPAGAREKSRRPQGKLFIPSSPPSSTDSTPSSSPQVQHRGCAPRLLGKSSKSPRGMQKEYDLSTWEPGQGGIPGYTEVDEGKRKTKEDRKAKQSEKSSKKDEYGEEWEKIRDVPVPVLGRSISFRGKKKERPTLRVPKQEMSEKAKKVYQKRLLERKLKAKQAELESVELLLGKDQVVSSTVLHEWREQHDEFLKSLDGQSRDQLSSDSDPDSTADMPMSSSMSSINTNSTTTSAHENPTILGEDMTTVSDGTTSGCDVQTPSSDVAPTIGDTVEDTLKSTDNSLHQSPTRLEANATTRKADSGTLCDDGDSAFAKSEDVGVVASRTKDSERLATGRSESEASETSL
ncbi:CNK3/IPCEF1 fusion protein-like isoform X1 [Lytechinus variegatus]|uniref:CNK3/IPCEF1 fusion protein-like isoform X1 n=1 Tax=Lytechinus variegatus TaxID=7654 RepID=UPI001BB11A25|nr:CNK3/IPCEF1 fusion protein-like isoform X1 [Lytechinus variegatus]